MKYEQIAQGIIDLQGHFFLACVEAIFFRTSFLKSVLPLPLGITIIANFPESKAETRQAGIKSEGIISPQTKRQDRPTSNSAYINHTKTLLCFSRFSRESFALNFAYNRKSSLSYAVIDTTRWHTEANQSSRIVWKFTLFSFLYFLSFFASCS